MKVFIAADHNGFQLKAHMTAYLQQGGYEVDDAGDATMKSEDDFPQFAERLVHAMQAEPQAACGVLICGSGQGMCMAANRFKGIRASLCYDIESARSSRNDDDANVLCLPARTITNTEAEDIAHEWLTTAFAGAARFKRRIKELDDIAYIQN